MKQAGVENGTIDLAISSSSDEVSPDKKAVLQGVYDALADGGEFYFSDVYCDRRLDQGMRKDPVLLGECLGGAMYVEDFKRLCVSVGFTDPRVLEGHVIEVKDEKLQELLGEATFYSITYRLFKLPAREGWKRCASYSTRCTKEQSKETRTRIHLDDHHRLETGKPMLVCGNTGSMLGETWLGNTSTWLAIDRSITGCSIADQVQ